MARFLLAMGLLNLALVVECSAVTGPDGADYTFGPWLGPEALTVASEAGPISLTRRSLAVTRRAGPEVVYTTTIDWLSLPSLNLNWLGPRLDGYFVFNGAILGFHTLEGRLMISPGFLNPGGDLTNALENAAIGHPFSISTNSIYLDLNYAFGQDAIRPRRDARLFQDALKCAGVQVSPGLVKFDFQSMVAKRISLAALFPELAGSQTITDAMIREISFEGENAVILVSFPGDKRIEVLLGPGLELVGARKLEWNRHTGRFDAFDRPIPK